MTEVRNVESQDTSSAGTRTAKAKPPLFPENVQFWFETVRAFGAASYGGSEFGEVLATSARIVSGDFDSWYNAWNETAERVSKAAAEQLTRGHRIRATFSLKANRSSCTST